MCLQYVFVFLLISSSIKAVTLIWYFILQRYNHHVAPKGKPMLTLCLCTINRWHKHKTHSSFQILFLSNASLSLLLNMYWSCQTLLILYFPLWSLSIYIYPFCILLHSVLYIYLSSVSWLLRAQTCYILLQPCSFFLFIFLPLSLLFSPSLSTHLPPPALSLSLSLSFFGYEALVVIIGRWQACRQLHSGESQVPQGAFFYLFVSCNTAPATDLWYPCRARGSQVHPIKNGLKLTLIFPFLKRDCGKRQFHDYRVDFFFYLFFYFLFGLYIFSSLHFNVFVYSWFVS